MKDFLKNNLNNILLIILIILMALTFLGIIKLNCNKPVEVTEKRDSIKTLQIEKKLDSILYYINPLLDSIQSELRRKEINSIVNEYNYLISNEKIKQLSNDSLKKWILGKIK